MFSKILKYVFSRLFWAVLAIILQIGVLAFLLIYLGKLSITVTIYSAVAAVLAMMIFCRDDAPEYRISWILVVLVIPVVGGMLYLFFGNKRQGKKEKRIREKYKAEGHEFWKDATGKALDYSVLENPEDRNLAKYIYTYSNARIYGNSPVKYYPQSDRVYKPLIEELEKAEKFIFMEFFIYDEGMIYDRVMEILKEKASNGVRVCLIYDDIGCAFTLKGNYESSLRKAGIQAVCFNPIKPRLNPRLNYRDHRKMCIVDGNTAISGGLNIADEYFNNRIRFGHWKDNAFIIRGAGVWNCTLMFMNLWNFVCPRDMVIKDFGDYAPTVFYKRASGLIQSYGDSPLDDDRVAENAYITIINNAHDYVWISTPYLILDSVMQDALILAAKSGVDVRIITPGIPDKKFVFEVTQSNFYRLVENGVKIYSYEPGFIHAKMFVSDGKRAILGTTNMDFRSFFMHFECATVFYGGKTVREVKADFDRTFELCRQVPSDYRKRVGILRRVFRGIARAVAPML